MSEKTLNEVVQALGMDIINEGPNWVLGEIDNGEGHIGGRLLNLVQLLPDGSVTLYAEVDSETTPENIQEISHGFAASESYPSLPEFYYVVQKSVVEEILDGEEFTRDHVILALMEAGWQPIRNTGKVRHKDKPEFVFNNWMEVMKACISIASEF